MKRHLEYSDKRGTNLLGSYTPCFLKTSATIGTVELTGLEITSTKALGAVVAIPVARSRTIPALICRKSGNRSSTADSSVGAGWLALSGRRGDAKRRANRRPCDEREPQKQRESPERGALPWSFDSTGAVGRPGARPPIAFAPTKAERFAAIPPRWSVTAELTSSMKEICPPLQNGAT